MSVYLHSLNTVNNNFVLFDICNAKYYISVVKCLYARVVKYTGNLGINPQEVRNMTERALKLWADGNDTVFVYYTPKGYVRAFTHKVEGKTNDERVKNAEKLCKEYETAGYGNIRINGTPYKEWMARYPSQKDLKEQRKNTRATPHPVPAQKEP